MQIFRRKSIDNNTFFAIPRNSLKIPCKFLVQGLTKLDTTKTYE